MTSSPLLYCNNCGAANQGQAAHCFACEEPLHVPAREIMLKERYRLIGPVGQGAFGPVYKAEDTQFGNRLVAIKEINLSGLTTQEAIEATDAFNREVLVLSGLAHANLPHMHDHFTDTKHWYLVIDFIEGETLEQYLNRTQNGRLPREEVLKTGIQLCTVLDYLHTHEPPIIFRDLKPANVMRTADGHFYLIDFGIARHFKPGQARDTMALGSPGYAAPEQYGRAQTTPQADIYSLGAMLHQLLTGIDPTQTPFRFALLPSEDQASPDRLQSLLLQMVAMDVNERPASIAAVKQELEQIAAISLPVGTTLATYGGHNRLVLAAAWSPDGNFIVSGSSDGTIHVWDATSGQNRFIHRNPAKWYAWTCALAWSPDGTFIAAGSDDKLVRVWQVENVGTAAVRMKPFFTYRGHSNWVNAVAWSPCKPSSTYERGLRIASGSDDKTVQIWQVDNTASCNQVEVYRGHSRWVVALAWSPDGNFIASGGNDAVVHVWDAATKETLLIYRGHAFGVNALAWSPDSTRIASCSWDNIVRIWDVATGKTILTYRGHSNWVNALAWSPDGTRIASASKDKTVQVWDATTGDTLFTYRGHSRWVYAVAWSPGGPFAFPYSLSPRQGGDSRIASGGYDKTVQVWQV